MGTLGTLSDVKYCVHCVHYRPLYRNGNTAPKVCHYILDTGYARGCPPGNGCNQRKTAAQWKKTKQGAAKLEGLAHSSNGGKQTRTHTPWSAGTDEQLLRLRARGMTTKQIAARMGKTESAITSRVRDLRKRGVLK